MMLNECTRRLWGNSQTFRPYMLDATFGVGQFMKVWPMNYRPRFYVIQINPQISFDTRDEDRFSEDLEQVIEAIEDEVGTCCEDHGTKDCRCDGFEVWPSFTENSWAGWCWARMDEDELRELMP
jgi:hypothetical protein